MSYRNSSNFRHDKYGDNQDKTSLNKLRSKYWTTKQLVIKKLGREQDEFVIASDSDVDAKLELLGTIKQSCNDLIRIMNRYQTNVLLLSHEETDMARFLKDYAQADKNRAGKIMASVSKVLAYTAQQRLALRQPLFRLHNEIETFRLRAVTDTLATVNRMETARTEYRGSILWLKDASVQLDPEKQLEKFRRVQSQVKTSKQEYDKLKSDVIQKIDLLTASRCNMYSHVLAPYQKTLLAFWAKTSKVMSAVAESFKGYEYYEFTVIKELAVPNHLLAEMSSSSFLERKLEETDKEKQKVEKDDTLIDLADSRTDEQKALSNSIRKDENHDISEPINALIDISDAQLDDQLIELEKLTTIESTATNGATGNHTKMTSNTFTDSDNLVELTDSSIEHDKLFSDLLSPSSSSDSNLNDLLGAHETNNFDADWTSAFGNNTSNQQVPTSTNPANTAQTNSTFLPSSLLSELLTSNNKTSTSNIPSSTNSKAKPTMTGKSATDKSNWFDLFAELDPLQDPDAIGKSVGAEANRNC
ncbi:unnamed protein product [Adineta ricciae]|uniref:AH domain-containing protein n=1 Tax=Adineta ricciae TaxID=249248 RepID=A0A814T206_ADIRI|nr:unnamed protein product [Adineta ricciae]CAF1152290.1 unnamed protein product [Adineta ricciae]